MIAAVLASDKGSIRTDIIYIAILHEVYIPSNSHL